MDGLHLDDIFVFPDDQDFRFHRATPRGLCQQINLDIAQNLGISIHDVDERAVRARMRQIEHGVGI